MSDADDRSSTREWLGCLALMLAELGTPFRTERQRRHIQVTIRRLQQSDIVDFQYHFIRHPARPRRWFCRQLAKDLEELATSPPIKLAPNMELRPGIVRKLRAWRRVHRS